MFKLYLQIYTSFIAFDIGGNHYGRDPYKTDACNIILRE